MPKYTTRARQPIPSAEDEPTLTVDQVAAILGISRASAYNAVRDGQIPSIELGRRKLVPTAALRSMLGLDPNPGRSDV